MPKKKSNLTMKHSMWIVLGVVVCTIALFSISSILIENPQSATGYAVDNPFGIIGHQVDDGKINLSPDPKGDGTDGGTTTPSCNEGENRQADDGTYNVKQCLDADEDSLLKPCLSPQITDETCDVAYKECCWTRCGNEVVGIFGYGLKNYDRLKSEEDEFFKKTNEEKEVPILNFISDLEGTNKKDQGCSYDGTTCKDGGCGTCVGGFTRETIYAIKSLSSSKRVGFFTITGGSEQHKSDGSPVHEPPTNERPGHHAGASFDVRGWNNSKEEIDKLVLDETDLTEKGFFNKYGFTKNSIECTFEKVNDPVNKHYHCNVDQGEVEKILNCEINSFTIED